MDGLLKYGLDFPVLWHIAIVSSSWSSSSSPSPSSSSSSSSSSPSQSSWPDWWPSGACNSKCSDDTLFQSYGSSTKDQNKRCQLCHVLMTDIFEARCSYNGASLICLFKSVHGSVADFAGFHVLEVYLVFCIPSKVFEFNAIHCSKTISAQGTSPSEAKQPKNRNDNVISELFNANSTTNGTLFIDISA